MSRVIEETLLLIEGQLEEERIVLERCLAPSLPKVKGNVSQLDVKSETGNGNTFIMTLPAGGVYG